MSRTIIYVRKSSESDDRQVLSLDQQLHWAREACAKAGIRNPIVIREARSAKTPGRPEFNHLMSLVLKGEVDTVVAWKADRLARNAADAGAVLFALESTRLQQIISSDRTYTEDADSAFMLSIELGLSAKYSKDLSKNVRRGIAEKLRRGEWSWRAPLGYKNVRQTADRSVIALDPPMAARIRQLFDLAATGNYSLHGLTRIFRDEWRLNVRRGSKAAKNARGISSATMHFILRNRFYTGVMVVKGEVYLGSHLPLVTKEQFDRVQRILASRNKRAERPQRYSFSFTGILRCGKCGRNMTGYLRRKPSGKQYTYYVCSNHLRQRCDQPLVPEPQIFSEVFSELSRVSLTAEEATTCYAMLEEMKRGVEASVETLRAGRAAEVAAIERRRERLLDLFLSGAIEKGEFDSKRRELDADRVNALLAEASVEATEAERFDLTLSFVESLRDATSAFQKGSNEDRRFLLRDVGFELSARGKKLHVQAGEAASLFMRRGDHPEWWTLLTQAATTFGAEQAAEENAR
jgi:DNA invertase Pin-like site-specific DNA recombinase